MRHLVAIYGPQLHAGLLPDAGEEVPPAQQSQVARYWPPRDVPTQSFDLVRGRVGKPRVVHHGAGVCLNSRVYDMRHGRCEAVRILPTAYAAQVDDLKKQIGALRARLREVQEEGWRRGQAVVLADFGKAV